uniref:Centrosomal protein of 162 kDa n=1 Tax=Macrostomum lignano TaxID=282301 RepID=A0A1I8H196_9PLAT
VHAAVDDEAPVHVRKPKKPTARAVTEKPVQLSKQKQQQQQQKQKQRPEPAQRGGSQKRSTGPGVKFRQTRTPGAGYTGSEDELSPRDEQPVPSRSHWIDSYESAPKAADAIDPLEHALDEHRIESSGDDPVAFEGRLRTLMSEVDQLKLEAAETRARHSSDRQQDQQPPLSGEAPPHPTSSAGVRILADAEADLDALSKCLEAAASRGRLAPPSPQFEAEIRSRIAAALDATARLRRAARRLADAEAASAADSATAAGELASLTGRLAESERRRTALEADTDALRAELAAARERVGAAESARGHLRLQLRQREADCDRLAVQLRGLEAQLAQARIDRDSLEQAKESQAAATELAATKSRCEQLERENQQLQAASGQPSDSSRMHESIRSLERQLETQRSECEGLRNAMRHYESLIEEYKQQVQQRTQNQQQQQQPQPSPSPPQSARRRADEAEAAKTAELLRLREAELDEANAKLKEYESGAAASRARSSSASASEDETRRLRERCDDLEQRLRAADEERRDALRALAKREDAERAAQDQLEAKRRECAALMQQVEQLSAAERDRRDTSPSGGRRLQSRCADLESQLAAQRAEAARALRESEEETRRCQRQVGDMQERLDRAEATARSLQSHVNFLKSSYANLFSATGAPPLVS